MADIKVLYINTNGEKQEHSESLDSLKMLSFKTANHTLSDSSLGKLVSGTVDASDLHNHDGRYFTESEHIASTTGVSDAGKPVKTDAAGYINSLIDVTSLASQISHSSLDDLEVDSHTQYIKHDGTRAFTGAQSMGGFKLTNLANPTVGTDAVNLQTLQAYQQGMKPKEAVRVATVAAGTLASSFAAGQVVDGITLAAGNRILIKNQTNASENGIYVVQASGAPVRAVDFDSLTPIDEINGSLVGVQEGTTNAGKTYVQQGTVSTLGTDSINFVFFNAADSITASTGVTRVANDIQLAPSVAGDGLSFLAGILNVNVDGSSLEINADTLRVKAAGIKETMIDFGIGAGQVSAGDIPIVDAGAFFTTDNVEAALQDTFRQARFGGTFQLTAGEALTAGDAVYISANDTVMKYSTLSGAVKPIGIVNASYASGATSVRVIKTNTWLKDVYTGLVAGETYYWTGSGISLTAPNGTGQNVYAVGEAKSATSLVVDFRHIKKNA